jgi:hypothetical protein
MATSTKNPNDPGSKPNAGDKQAAKQRASSSKREAPPAPGIVGGAQPQSRTVKVADFGEFVVGQEAPSDLFAVMDDNGVEDAFSTEPPERGHQLAFKGRVVDQAVVHQIQNVQREAAQA